MARLRQILASKIRRRRGTLTQQDFARRIGLHQASINRIELGTQNVTIDTLQLLCDRFNCSAADLLDEGEN
ncbi:helix-turn-helix domain-containing protein [Hyphococcus sp.]|uniref:helix-turn-helix domain-containing protein n=1 Tax=Hyphococcus sp. TaxID=2038636 RepID=UPI0035C7202F